ncbi:MAG: hypothetical protein HC867_01205 [Bacteroidia bacterium]|nr:hypothetical protein [Bacteroidia bacterium]
MKHYLLTILSFLFVLSLFSQSYENQVEFQKKSEQAWAIDFPYPPSVVEDALVKKLDEMGLKTKESKGFRNYKGSLIKSISTENMDYVFRVERKSKKERDESVVYMMIYKGDANMFSLLAADIKSQAKNFLNSMSPFMEAYNLEVEIRAQEEIVAKEEKKLKNLEEDADNLQKKLKKLEDDIEENKKDQKDQQKEIENQKKILDSLARKRKNF